MPEPGCRKVRHKTEAAAVAHARKLRAFEAMMRSEDRRVKALAYLCPRCRHWHVGHTRVRLVAA